MAIRRIEEPESSIHEQGYPANEPPPEAEHSSYALTEAAKEKLKTIAANILDCEERAKEANNEKRQFIAEAKAAGYDPKALRAALAYLKDAAGRDEAEQLRDLYVEALRDRL